MGQPQPHSDRHPTFRCSLLSIQADFSSFSISVPIPIHFLVPRDHAVFLAKLGRALFHSPRGQCRCVIPCSQLQRLGPEAPRVDGRALQHEEYQMKSYSVILRIPEQFPVSQNYIQLLPMSIPPRPKHFVLYSNANGGRQSNFSHWLYSRSRPA